MKKTPFIVMCLFLLTVNIVVAEDFAPLQVPGAITVNTPTSKLLFNKGYIFIDVRKSVDFNNEHIPGARHLFVNSDNFTARNLQAMANKDQAFVFYCNGIRCPGSSKASQKAAEWGWRTIFYYREGMPGWKEAGFAVE
jgi:rhodanese-related sulfurtransferase